MRALLLALVAVLVTATSFFGPPSTTVRAQAREILPTEAELNATLAPFTVADYMVGPGKDGWDANAEFDIKGSPEGQLHSSVNASELPTSEGAAGFLQTKLQQLRDDVRKLGFVGDLVTADASMTLDADEAYWGVFTSDPDQSPPMIAAVHLSRYEDQVIATTVMMLPSGPVTEATTQRLGIITAQMLHLMNSD